MYQLTTDPNVVLRLDDGAILPTDPDNRDYQDFLAWQAAGNVPGPVPAPTLAEMSAGVVVKVQQRLDAFAGTRGYDGILSACTYATSTIAKFQGEGTYCVAARDATWSACYTGLAAVQAGTQPMPASVDDAIAQLQLPDLAWPDAP